MGSMGPVIIKNEMIVRFSHFSEFYDVKFLNPQQSKTQKPLVVFFWKIYLCILLIYPFIY